MDNSDSTVAALRQHIETLQQDMSSMKRRHALEVKQLREEVAHLQQEVGQVVTMLTGQTGRASKAATRSPVRATPASALVVPSPTHADAAGRSVSRVVAVDASTQCSSFHIPGDGRASGMLTDGGTGGGGGGTPSRTSDIATLTTEADRLIKAIQTLREERTPPAKRTAAGASTAVASGAAPKQQPTTTTTPGGGAVPTTTTAAGGTTPNSKFTVSFASPQHHSPAPKDHS